MLVFLNSESEMLSTFLIIEVRLSDCIFIELSREGSLFIDVWEIYVCVWNGGCNLGCLIRYLFIATDVFGRNDDTYCGTFLR